MFKSPYLHIFLFVITLLTTTIAGGEWITGKSFYFHHQSMGWNEFVDGFMFSIPFMTFLTFHEFGHYFAAKRKNIEVSLPYYMPAWFIIFTSIGTFGAFIKIKEPVKTKKDYFDIGIAGPLAGFIVALIVLALGFHYLPSDEYVYKIHPQYLNFKGNYRQLLDAMPNTGEAIVLGKSLIYSILEQDLADPTKIPHPYELTHYPLIVAGFLGLLFTAINLLPIGQLDGGHILYALIGKKAFNIVSPSLLILFVSYAGLGMFKISDFQIVSNANNYTNLLNFVLFTYFNYLCFSKICNSKLNNLIIALSVILAQLFLNYLFPNLSGYSGFLAFGFLIGRFLGVYHPDTDDTRPIGTFRKVLGWLSLLIFVLCFSPNPII